MFVFPSKSQEEIKPFWWPWHMVFGWNPALGVMTTSRVWKRKRKKDKGETESKEVISLDNC